MRILITGAAGFIGSHLADRLLAEGHEVTGVDNFETGSPANWPVQDESWLYDASISDRETFYRLANVCEPELVIHCAASYKDPLKWHRDTDTNVIGTINTVLAAQHHGARLIYFQTALCYGNNPYQSKSGRTSTVMLPLSTHAPLNPESSYAISKTAGEQYIRLSGVPFYSFRLANIYGPRNLSGPIPAFYKHLTAGKLPTVVGSRRDFVYITDLVDLVMQSVNGEGEPGIYHVSTGRDHAIIDLFDQVAAAVTGKHGYKVAIRQPRGPDDAPTILLDPSLTEQTFGWKATTPLTEGIAKAVDWYRDNPVGETYTHLAVKG